ncbi:Uncharacterized protein Rs2_34889 [Raphanus sativus]|nr:Uncharacterized protein Rs2_34889 [Raphanus sativus]
MIRSFCSHNTKTHVAAEKKRLGLLEAEKKARARVQKAKRHISEFLHQRRRQRDSISIYCDMLQQDDDHLSRKLSRCWRCFFGYKIIAIALLLCSLCNISSIIKASVNIMHNLQKGNLGINLQRTSPWLGNISCLHQQLTLTYR